MTPDSPVCRPLKIRLFVTLALLLLAGPGQAQISNLLSAKPKSETVKPAEAPAAVDPRTEAEKQLAEARRQQEAGRIESGTAPKPTASGNRYPNCRTGRSGSPSLPVRRPTRRSVSMRCATNSI